MMNNIIRPGFSGSNLIATLEDALQMARSGELVACAIIGVGPEGDYTIGGVSGHMDRLPIMSMIGELEYQKRLLLDEVER